MGESFIITKSEKDTRKLGTKIGELIKPGQIILLSGELGSGKTILVKGIGRALGIDENEVTSPSYTLIHEYQGDYPLYHMDLYRLNSADELYDIGFEEYLEKRGIIVIEWPEIADEILLSDFLKLKFKILNINKRKILIEACGKKSSKVKEGLTVNADSGN